MDARPRLFKKTTHKKPRLYSRRMPYRFIRDSAFYNQRDISFTLAGFADRNSDTSPVSQQGVMFDQQNQTRSPVIKDTG